MSLPKVVYIMGPPGAGKGTQAMMLAESIGYHQFSTGAAMRELAHQDTELGREVKNLIDNGILASPELAARIVTSAIEEYINEGTGLIFDGTPRTVAEAEIIERFFEEKGYGRPTVMVLNVEKEDMIERNSKRLYCLDVTPDFPIIHPEDEDRCKTLGGVVARRPDDDPAKMGTRWEQFMKHTWPVIQKYRERGWVHEIDGKHAIEQVHGDVMRAIEELKHDPSQN